LGFVFQNRFSPSTEGFVHKGTNKEPMQSIVILR